MNFNVNFILVSILLGSNVHALDNKQHTIFLTGGKSPSAVITLALGQTEELKKLTQNTSIGMVSVSWGQEKISEAARLPGVLGHSSLRYRVLIVSPKVLPVVFNVKHNTPIEWLTINGRHIIPKQRESRSNSWYAFHLHGGANTILIQCLQRPLKTKKRG